MQQEPAPLVALLRNKSRSLGVKLIVVSGLALLMTIPSFFVDSIVEERSKLNENVIQEISNHVGGQQTFLGPILTVPYTIPPSGPRNYTTEGLYVIFPAKGNAQVKIRTEERRRSLFRVPVYQADLKFDATFDFAGVPSVAPAGAILDWRQAAIVVAASDARGAMADGTLTTDGKTVTLTPAESLVPSTPDQHLPLTYFGVALEKAGKPNTALNVSVNLHFTGAQRLAILAYGKSTHITAEGDWPNPGFNGSFLPATRTISAQGFSAEWSVPYIARGVPAEGLPTVVRDLDRTALGVSLIELADPYQSVSRSLKYVLLFIGLLFLTYFTFEATTGKRVHSAQYVLVGMAHMIFYLLLLSLAERFGFDWGFLVAGGATVLLLSANAQWIFASRIQGVRALLVFGLLYFFIYLLLRLDDNALLVGAVASFLAVAAVMYFTRNIDWYNSMTNNTER